MLPFVLSTTAGAVDVIGFLTLGGLFTAHITGNLVIVVAHYLTGRFGQIGPLLSVPIFITVLGAITAIFARREILQTRRTLLVLHAVFLTAFLGFGVMFGPFANPDGGTAIFVGMRGVAAMAIQNALIKARFVRFSCDGGDDHKRHTVGRRSCDCRSR